MEIEIVTTKKKLTKSLIEQMPVASIHVMTSAKVLGYYIDKKHGKIAIMSYLGEYYTRALGYKNGSNECCVYRKNTLLTFDTPLERDTWMEAYEPMQEKALKTHIYI